MASQRAADASPASSSVDAAAAAIVDQTLTSQSESADNAVLPAPSVVASAQSPSQTTLPRPFSIEFTEPQEHDSVQSTDQATEAAPLSSVDIIQSQTANATSPSAATPSDPVSQDASTSERALSGTAFAGEHTHLDMPLAPTYQQENQNDSGSSPQEAIDQDLSGPALSPKIGVPTSVTGALVSPAISERSIPGQPKKFSSSLRVNKKFLEKAIADPKSASSSRTGSPAAPQRVPTPLAAAPTPIYQTGPSLQPSNSALPPSGPRLLTGKISTSGIPMHGTAGPSSSGSSSWGRQLRSPSAELPTPTFFDQTRGSAYASNTGRYQAVVSSRGGFQSQGMSNGRGRGGRPMGAAPWASHAQDSVSSYGRGGEWGVSGEFPSVVEASRSKELKARALATALAAKEAKDKSSKLAAAEAAAAYRKHLIEDLDAFRGTHLDPNANHWDEMGDEDDDFGDIVDFGDGATYKIPLEDSQELPPASTRPALPTASIGSPSSNPRSAQPAGDFDRGVPHSRAFSENKSLFNDRLGKLEPYDHSTNHSTKNHTRAEKRELPPSQVLKRPEKQQSSLASTTGPVTSSLKAGTSTNVPVGQDHPASKPPKQAWAIPTRPTAVDSKSIFPSSSSDPLPASSAALSVTAQPILQPNPQSSTTSTSKESLPAPTVSAESVAELHKREMQSAAERARKRKQEEAAAAQAAVARARSKAQAMDQKHQSQTSNKPSIQSTLPDAASSPQVTIVVTTHEPTQALSHPAMLQPSTSRSPEGSIELPIARKTSADLDSMRKDENASAIRTSTDSKVSNDQVPPAPLAAPKHQSMQTTDVTEVLAQVPQPNRQPATALTPTADTPSRAEESSSWRRSTILPTAAPPIRGETTKPARPLPSSSSASHRDSVATAVEKALLPERPSPRSVLHPRSNFKAEDAVLRPKASSPDTRSIPHGDATHESSAGDSKTPTVHLHASTHEAKNSTASRLPYKPAEMSSLNDAMSRLQELLVSGKSKIEDAPPSSSDKKVAPNQVLLDSDDRRHRQPTELLLPSVQRAVTPVADETFSISRFERAPSPRSVWKVIPKLKFGTSNGRLPPLTNRQQSNLHRQNRPDRLFTVSWNTSRSEGLSNLFREQALFPPTSLILRLPGHSRRQDQTTSANPSARDATNATVETFQTVVDLSSDATGEVGNKNIAVILPKVATKGSTRGPTVKLPGKAGLLPSLNPTLEGSGDILDASMPIWNDSDQLSDPTFRYPVPPPDVQAPVSSFSFDSSSSPPIPRGDLPRTHRSMASGSGNALPTTSASAEPSRYHRSSRSVSNSTWDEGPLSLSVVKNVWAQPNINEDASASNSLRDLVDDFPSTLPSMNDLKAEEESSADGASDKPSRVTMYPHTAESTVNNVAPSSSMHAHPSSTFAEQYSSPSVSTAFQPNASPYARDDPLSWQRPILNGQQYGANTAYHQQPYPSYSPNMAASDFTNGIWLPQQPPRQQMMGFSGYGGMNSPSHVPAGLPGAQAHSSRRNFTKSRTSENPFGANAFGNLQRGGPNAYLNPTGMSSQQSVYGRF